MCRYVLVTSKCREHIVPRVTYYYLLWGVKVLRSSMTWGWNLISSFSSLKLLTRTLTRTTWFGSLFEDSFSEYFSHLMFERSDFTLGEKTTHLIVSMLRNGVKVLSMEKKGARFEEAIRSNSGWCLPSMKQLRSSARVFDDPILFFEEL